MLRHLLKRILEPFRKNGNWDATTALEKGRVATRRIDGREVRWLVTNKHDEIQSAQMRDGFYECRELLRLRDALGPQVNVLDIGANIGNHALFFMAMMGAKVVTCVEPYAKARMHLLVNLGLNGSIADEVRVLSCAMGAARTTGSIVEPTEFNIGLTRVDTGSAGDTPIYTADEIIGKAPLDFVKIDVEGMELDVLGGMSEILSNQRPALYIEVSTSTFDEVVQILSGAGYEKVGESPAYTHQTNLTFVHRERSRSPGEALTNII